MNGERLSILQSMPIFGGLEESTLDFLLENSIVKTYEPGEYFFRQGDKGDSIYIIQEGTVSISKTWKRDSYELARLGKGDCVGEMELIDIGHRSASVIALDEVRVIILSRRAIFDLYERDLEQFTTIQMNMGREVSRRLRKADELLFHEHMKSEALEEQVRESGNAIEYPSTVVPPRSLT